MIINDLYIHKIISLDRKTDTILTIYPNAELTSPLATQSFQMIRRRYTQIIKTCGIIHHNKLSECYSLNIPRKLSGKIWLYIFSVSLSAKFFIIPALYPKFVYMSIRHKTSRFSAGTKKIWYKRGVPRWKSTGAIIMKNCREACSRGCHLSCRIIITPKYEQTMNKPNFFVLFSQLSTSTFLFIVNIHNILTDMLILRPSDITYFQGLQAIP